MSSLLYIHSAYSLETKFSPNANLNCEHLSPKNLRIGHVLKENFCPLKFEVESRSAKNVKNEHLKNLVLLWCISVLELKCPYYDSSTPARRCGKGEEEGCVLLPV